MADTLAELYVKIGSDFQKTDSELDRLHQRINRIDPSINKMERSFASVNKAITAIGGAVATLGIARLGNDIISASTKFDGLNRMLVNVEGSQEKANKRFEEFRKLAKEPVLDPFNLSKYYTALKSVNMEADLSIRFMKSLANAMAGVGASNEQFALAMEQVVQMAGKGKVMGDDLRAIANSFPQIRKYLVDAFGTAIPEELAKKGLDATQVLKGLNAEMEKAPKFAGGAQAAQDNFKQSLELFEATLGKAVLPTISDFLNKLTELMDKFNELPESTQKVIGTGVVAGIGGAGLVGIAMTLKSIAEFAGLAKSGLAGLSAVNIASTATQGVASASGGIGASVAGLSTLGALNLTLAAATITIGSAVLGYKLATDPKVQDWLYGVPKKTSGLGQDATTQELVMKLGGLKEGSPEYLALVEQIKQSAGGVFTATKATEKPIDWSKFAKADYSTPSQPILSGSYYASLDKHITPIPYGNVYDPRFSQISMFSSMLSGIQAPYYKSGSSLSELRSYAPETPSMRGFPREYSSSSGGLFGTQVSGSLQATAKAIEQINSDIDKQNESLDQGISKSIKQINQDWQDIGGYIEKADDKQSRFWKNLEDMGAYSMDRVVDKGMNDLFGRLFGSELDKSQQTWKDFLAEMLKEYAISLGKMLLQYAAYEAGKWAVRKTFGGSENAETGGDKKDTYNNPSLGELTGAKAEWNQWYGEGFLVDWITPDSAEDKAYKAQMKSYASGGISWRPEIALVGEHPEAHIPLQGGKVPVSINSASSGVNVGTMNINLIDSDIKDPNLLRRKVVDAFKQAQINGEI